MEAKTDTTTTTTDAGVDAGKTALDAAAADTKTTETAKTTEGAKNVDGEKKADVTDRSALDNAGKKPDEEKKADEKKSTEEKKSDEPVPLVYAKELKRPDGIPWDEQGFDAVAPVLAKHGIPKEAAQDLLDAYGASLAKRQAESIAANAEIRKTMRAEVMANMKPDDLVSARRALDRCCESDATRQAILSSPLGDDLAFVKMLAQFGRAIKDDSIAGATGSGGAGERPRLADRLYNTGGQPGK